MRIGKRHVRVVLRDQCLPRLPEMGQIVACPPIAQAPDSVEGCTLIIETVADFMSNDGPDRPVY